MTANKEWLKDIKISQELKDKIYYDEENDLWVISWNAISQSLTELGELKKQLQGNTLRNRNLILETSNKLLKEDLETKNKLLDLYRKCYQLNEITGEIKMSKDIENYSVQQCHDELVILESPKLPPEQSMYHDMALDVIASRKQRIKERLLQFEQSLAELDELKRDVKRYFELWEQAKSKWGNGINDIEANEVTKLHIKLSKVGNEE